MRIWNLTIGEPLPTDPGDPRLYRAGQFCAIAAAAGHEVVWWSSSFNHHTKQERWPGTRCGLRWRGGLIQALGGPVYSGNVSLARLRNHHRQARRFTELAERCARPDLIVCSYPDIFLARAGVAFGRRHGLPVIVDARDCWPDIFERELPAALRLLASAALQPLYRQSAFCFRACAAVTGITDSFVDWGLQRGGRRLPHRAFPLAYDLAGLEDDAVAGAQAYWRQEHGLTAADRIICFFGAISRQFDFEAILTVARSAAIERLKVVICGAGDGAEELQRRAADLPQVIFPGWIDRPKLLGLMRMSLAGLAPYRDNPDFRMSLPNKAIEYLAGGLPVLTSLPGELRALIEAENCGLWYPADRPEDLAAAIRRLAEDPSAREAMGRRGYALYRRRFDAQQVYPAMLDWCCEVAREWGRGAW
jgi:glycosyltransferase involved in cell wall biosynthesis